MRHVTVQLAPRGDGLQPFGTVVQKAPDVTRWAVHHFDPISEAH